MTGRPEGLLRSGALTFGGIVVGAVATLLLASLVGNGLGAAGTGRFFQAVALFAIVSNGLQLGADTALVRTLSRATALGEHGALRPIVRTALLPVTAASAAVSAVVLLTAAPIGAWIDPAAPAAAAALVRTMAPFLGAGALLTVLLGGTRGLGGTLPYTLLQNLGLPVSRLAVVAVGVAVGASMQWIAGGWAAVLAPVAVVAGIVLARRLRGASSAGDSRATEVAGPFWGFALPRGAATLVERALDWSGVLVVLAVAGPAAGGVYAVVNRCVTAGAMIEQAARIVVGPRISRALAVGDRAEASRLFLDVTRALVVVGWPFHLLLAVFAPAVLSVFGPEFVAGAPALALVALATMLATSAGMVQSVLLMGGRSSWQLGNRLIQLAVLLTVTTVLVPRLGLVGAAIGWIAAIVVDTALATVQVAVRMRIRSSLRLILLPAGLALAVFAGGGGAAALAFGRTLPVLAVAAPVLLLVYGAACLLLRDRLGLGVLRRPRTDLPLPGAVSHDAPAPDRVPAAVPIER